MAQKGVDLMGAFDFFKKTNNLDDPKLEKNEEAIKIVAPDLNFEWINVSLNVLYSKESAKEQVQKIAEDVVSVLINTQMIIGENSGFLGYINPYLGLNAFVAYDKNEKKIIRKLTHSFSYGVFKDSEEDKWRIFLFPLKNDKELHLYSLIDLDYDLLLLAQANKWIIERTKLPLRKGSMDISMDGDRPLVTYWSGVLKFVYSVEMRIRYAKFYPEKDRSAFQEDIHKMLNRLKKDSKKMKLSSEDIKWFKKVDELLKIRDF
ncbi:MAG: hypothetical protein WC308_00620 [archaeon]|jgi:hypothetical protein